MATVKIDTYNEEDSRFFLDDDGDLNIVLDDGRVVCLEATPGGDVRAIWTNQSNVAQLRSSGQIARFLRSGDTITITV